MSAPKSKSDQSQISHIAPCSKECPTSQYIQCNQCKSQICLQCFLTLIKRYKIKMKKLHYSIELYYKCHKCLSLSPFKAYRSLNRKRKEYAEQSAHDPMFWICDNMRFVWYNEEYQYIDVKGYRFPLRCFSGNAYVKVDENGCIEVRQFHSKEFHEAMRWNIKPLRYYGTVCESRLQHSNDIEEEIAMLQINYVFEVAIALHNIKLNPMGPTEPPRYKNQELDTDWADIIEDYDKICDAARSLFTNGFV
eukprot:317793_1